MPGWMGKMVGAGRTASPFRVFMGDQFMMNVKTGSTTIGMEIVSNPINVDRLRSDLSSAMERSPECRKIDAIRGLIDITNDIVKSEISGRPIVFNGSNFGSPTTLKEKLNSTLSIDYLLRRYGKDEVRVALVELIDMMVKESAPIAMKSVAEPMLRR